MTTATVLLVVGCYVVIRAFAIEVAHAIRTRASDRRAAVARGVAPAAATVVAAQPNVVH
jgi:hypothetical protein